MSDTIRNIRRFYRRTQPRTFPPTEIHSPNSYRRALRRSVLAGISNLNLEAADPHCHMVLLEGFWGRHCSEFVCQSCQSWRFESILQIAQIAKFNNLRGFRLIRTTESSSSVKLFIVSSIQEYGISIHISGNFGNNATGPQEWADGSEFSHRIRQSVK